MNKYITRKFLLNRGFKKTDIDLEISISDKLSLGINIIESVEFDGYRIGYNCFLFSRTNIKDSKNYCSINILVRLDLKTKKDVKNFYKYSTGKKLKKANRDD